jgi:hypothetical protein
MTYTLFVVAFLILFIIIGLTIVHISNNQFDMSFVYGLCGCLILLLIAWIMAEVAYCGIRIK